MARLPSSGLRLPRLGVGLPRRPGPTIRLRLTLLYGSTFLITGALLLTIGYALVHHNLDARPPFRSLATRLGFPGPPRVSPGGPAFRFGPGSPEARVAEAVRRQLREDALHRLLVEYGLALAAMTVVSVGAGWLLAGRALRPLREITATARRVSGENLGERIALQGPADELRELAETFDRMLARLDGAFRGQRHFVANASHELRTPLAIMRTEIDVALADEDASAAELRAMGEALRDAVDRSEGLIESLLMLARSESASGSGVTLDLAALAADCLTDLERQAHAGEIVVSMDLPSAFVRGDPALLERMVSNLIENGIRHNVSGGFLSVATGSDADGAHLTVRNGGEPIAPQDAAELAEPFRRLTAGRAGYGLGLSIVRSVVEAHHGDLVLTAPEDGGLEVRITLPAAERTAGLVPLSLTPT